MEKNLHVLARTHMQAARILQAGCNAFNQYHFPTVMRAVDQKKMKFKRGKIL